MGAAAGQSKNSVSRQKRPVSKLISQAATQTEAASAAAACVMFGRVECDFTAFSSSVNGRGFKKKKKNSNSRTTDIVIVLENSEISDHIL